MERERETERGRAVCRRLQCRAFGARLQAPPVIYLLPVILTHLKTDERLARRRSFLCAAVIAGDCLLERRSETYWLYLNKILFSPFSLFFSIIILLIFMKPWTGA